MVVVQDVIEIDVRGQVMHLAVAEARELWGKLGQYLGELTPDKEGESE